MMNSRNQREITEALLMAKEKIIIISLVVAITIPLYGSATSPGIKAAYWPSYQPQSLPPSSIPTAYFTHVFYAFLLVEPDTFRLAITPDDDRKMAELTATVHAATPPARAVLSIGGAGANATVFSDMVGDFTNRARFIRSSIDVARKYGFDGVDLDWEFPSNARDMLNMGLLFKEWRVAINGDSGFYKRSGQARLTLSAAVYFSPTVAYPGNIQRTYPGDSIRRYADFISPMCFDYHGGWEPNVTGAHASLYDKTSNLSTSYGISAWKENDVPSRKIVMGMPVYGHTWELKDPNRHGIGAPAVGTGPGGGVLVYSDILAFNEDNNAVVVFDNVTVSTYSYAGTNWIGYDDGTSIEYKVKFAKAQGLGGYFFWALGFDSNWTLAKAASTAWDAEN